MKLRNGFSQETRNLHLYEYACMECGRSDLGLELHHLHGRCSNSPLNACRICPKCHTKGQRDDTFRSRMHQKILNFLERNEYHLTEEDNQFYDEYYN